MKKTTMLLFVVVAAGCVPSWNPLYTENDLAFDARLVGTWRPVNANEESRETWTFTRESEHTYRLAQTDEDGQKAQFEARLVKLQDYLFLDLYLTSIDEAARLNVWASFSLVPAHLILKVEQMEPVLKLATMNPTWMQKFVRNHPEAIAHRVVADGNIILTASTRDLQEFVLRHADEAQFFGGAMEMERNLSPPKRAALAN